MKKVTTILVITLVIITALPIASQKVANADQKQGHRSVKQSGRDTLGDTDALSGTDTLSNTGELGDTEFSIRRRSTMELWRHRDRYRKEVLKALRSDELETVERARWVVDRWRRGILANTQAGLVETLAEKQPVEAIEFLLESGDFASATIAMHEAQGTLEFEAIANQIATTLDIRFPVYARRAIQADLQEDLLGFLELAATTKGTVVCYRDWARLIDAERSSDQLLASLNASSLDHLNPSLGMESRCLLKLLDGDHVAAIQVAEKFDRQIQQDLQDGRPTKDRKFSRDRFSARQTQPKRPTSLVRIVRMLQSDWNAIARDSAKTAEACEDRGDAIRHWSDTLIAATRFGDDALAAKAAKGLAFKASTRRVAVAPSEDDADASEDEMEASQPSDPLADLSLPPEIQKLAWRTLLIHGYVDDAIEWVLPSDPGDAAMIALAASRPADAIRFLGFDPQAIDTQLETWIDSAVKNQRSLYSEMISDDPDVADRASQRVPSGIDPQVDSLFALIRLSLKVGRDDVAWRIADRLSQEDLLCKRGDRLGKNFVRDYVLLTLLMTTKSDWMIQLAYRDWENEPTLVSQSLVARITIVEDYQVLMILSALVRLESPSIASKEAFRIACEFARADDSDRKSHASWIPILYQRLRDGSLRRAVKDDPQLLAFLQPLHHVWSEIFLAYGRPDLSEPILQSRATIGELDAMLTLAQEYRLSNQTDSDESLDEAFEEIWAVVASPQSESEARFRDDVATGIEAIAGQARLATDRGDSQTFVQLLGHLRAMACTPSTDTRQKIADLLADLGQWEDAKLIYQSLLLMTALTSDETQSLIDIARNYQGYALRATRQEVDHTESALKATTIESFEPGDQTLRSGAVEWFDLAFVGSLASFDYRPQLYLVYPQLIIRERLEIALAGLAAEELKTVRKSKDATKPESDSKPKNATMPAYASKSRDRSESKREKVVKLVAQLSQFDSMDITTGESILPKLRHLGLDEQADQFLSDVLVAARTHLRSFPEDAMTANNVAWAAAVNDFELASVLELAKRAVQTEPDSAIYRDTLAEILARLGMHDQAFKIEKGCVLDDPGQWHLHEQIDRFKIRMKQR